MEKNSRLWIRRWVKIILPLYFFSFLSLSSVAQGLPLIRNYTAEEYGGHDLNYDIALLRPCPVAHYPYPRTKTCHSGLSRQQEHHLGGWLQFLCPSAEI